jgi:hypothetical protein
MVVCGIQVIIKLGKFVVIICLNDDMREWFDSVLVVRVYELLRRTWQWVSVCMGGIYPYSLVVKNT